MYTIKLFQTIMEMEKYLNDNSINKAKIVQIYFDAASGKHVLVISN